MLVGVEEINGGIIVNVGETVRLSGTSVATALQPVNNIITEKKVAILM